MPLPKVTNSAIAPRAAIVTPACVSNQPERPFRVPVVERDLRARLSALSSILGALLLLFSPSALRAATPTQAPLPSQKTSTTDATPITDDTANQRDTPATKAVPGIGSGPKSTTTTRLNLVNPEMETGAVKERDQAPSATGPQSVVVDLTQKGTSFFHFWEQMFGSGRAILSLRADYQDDLRTVRDSVGARYVRFHDILDDDIGLVSADGKGNLVYNFTEVDEIYDALVTNGVRPYVELSFMPRALAATTNRHGFWYPFLPNPPKDYAQWGKVISTLTRHLEGRYGAEEVRQWYFEVWNEPNLDFWTGKPAQATYFKLYDAAATAIKQVDPQLRVGGPATAQAAWIPDFIKHCVSGHIPVDFVSTHVYGDDDPGALGPGSTGADQKDFVGLAVKKVHAQVVASARPNLPIIWSEYNATFRNIPAVTDSAFMGPWLGNNISVCDGLVTQMSYWDFSDVFDEQGVRGRPFYGGYGVMAGGRIPKPAFNAFAMFHRLGNERLKASAPWILATRRTDGAIVIAFWNYAGAQVSTGPSRDYTIQLKGAKRFKTAQLQVLDDQHGSAMTAWEKLGSPQYPSFAELKALRQAGQLPPPTAVPIQSGQIKVTLSIHGLALVELK